MTDDFDPGAFRAKLRLANRGAKTGSNRGLRLGAEHLLKSARDIVPLEEGVLENSGKVTTNPATFEAAVSFDTAYAVRQHEELDFEHDPGRHAKYLETPMHTEAGTISRLVQGEVRKEMGF